MKLYHKECVDELLDLYGAHTTIEILDTEPTFDGYALVHRAQMVGENGYTVDADITTEALGYFFDGFDNYSLKFMARRTE